MTTQSATPDPKIPSSPVPAGAEAGDVLIALSAAGDRAQAGASWIKIAPRGRVTTRRGGSYAFDPEALAARFAKDETSVPFDFDHGTVKLAAQGMRVNAIGWIDQMEARADGLYGYVDWLDAGKAALSARTHRYVSPAFSFDDQGNAQWIHSVALTTAPDLSKMPALAHAASAGTSPSKTSPETETSMSSEIAKALGLSENADQAACLSAIQDMRSGKVSAEVHNETLATLNATKKELEDIKSGQHKASVDTVLDEAIDEGRIVPAQRDHYASLAATPEGLQNVTALLAATPKSRQPSGLDGRQPGTGGAKTFEPAALAASVRAYQKAQNEAGNPIGYLDAFAAVQNGDAGGAK